MKITWFGTASILLEAEGEKLLFDPFVQLAGGSNPNSLEDFPADTDICITHGHVDHLFFLPDLLAEQDITVYGTKAVMDTLEGWVEETGSLVQAEPGCSWRRGNMKITMLKGQHTRFTARMVLRKLINPRLFRYFRNTLFLAWAHPKFPEKGETVAYQIDAEGKGFFCWAAWPWIRIRYIQRTWISSYCLFREGRIWRKLQWRLWMN